MEEPKYYEKEDRFTKYYFRVLGNVVTALYGNKDGSRYGINLFTKVDSYSYNDCAQILPDKFAQKLSAIKEKLKV